MRDLVMTLESLRYEIRTPQSVPQIAMAQELVEQAIAVAIELDAEIERLTTERDRARAWVRGIATILGGARDDAVAALRDEPREP